MKTTDWIVAGSFLAAMLIIAILTAARLRSPADYFTAGRRVRRFMLILFAFGSGTSSDSQSSVMAGTWRAGLAGLWWQFLWLPITPFYWIVAPLLRRLRAITTADFFAMRFGPSTGALYSIYGMIISVVLMAGVLFTGSELLETLADPFFRDVSAHLKIQIPVIDFSAALEPPSADRPPIVITKSLGSRHVAAAALSLLLMAVAVIGGLGAAIRIDAVQGVLRIGLTLILLPMIFSRIGGFGALGTKDVLKPGMFDFVASSDAAVQAHQEPFTPFYLCMLSIAALAGIIVQPHIIAVCGTGRTEMDSRIGFTFGNLLKRCLSVLWAFAGLACIVWYLGPSSPLAGPDATPEQHQLHSALQMAASGDLSNLSPEERGALNVTNHKFADRLFGRVVRDVLQHAFPGMLGLVVAMVLASTISHCGTQMVVGSGLFAEHLYRHHLAPGRDPRHYLTVGRVCGPVLVMIALLLQTTFSDITDVLKLVIKTPAVIGISMWMGLVWTRWNTISVWSTTLTAALLGILCGYFPEEIQRTVPGLSHLMFIEGPKGLAMIDAWKIIWILFGGLLAGTIATLSTPPEPDAQLEYFYRVIRTPIAPNESQFADQYVPPEDAELAPAFYFAGFQFPGPTREGTIGFILAWVVVIGMVVITKWLSLML